jgi:16S rRNA (cytidine1402-2'-O)-methyltransferase
VALLTDAGTPTISDPGGLLVARARACGSHVIPIPGPSAVTTALSVAGFPADRYTFLGFLPRKGPERRRMLEEIAGSPRTVVLFEAANRLVRLLDDLGAACGSDRTVVVARELSKVHEEIKSGNLTDMRVYYEERPPRGEVTVVVEAGPPPATDIDTDAVERRARELLEHGITRKDTATRLAREFSLSRREAYRMVTEL